MNYSLVVHGGAGLWRGVRRRKGLRGVRRAASNGVDVLRNGGTALDAVESSVVSMEDDSTFNAGYGSSLNLLGRVEMDASIMDGRMITIDARGRIGSAHSTRDLCWAFLRSGMRSPHGAMG